MADSNSAMEVDIDSLPCHMLTPLQKRQRTIKETRDKNRAVVENQVQVSGDKMLSTGDVAQGKNICGMQP